MLNEDYYITIRKQFVHCNYGQRDSGKMKDMQL